MTAERKLDLLGGEALFDISCACGMDAARKRGVDGRWIYPAVLPDGGRVRMLKVLLDNSCKNDCAYCAQRAGRDTRRDRFAPEELARVFDQLLRARKVEALFLSSGIGHDAVRTMDRIIATTEIIRRRFRFRGFVHLKILPGAQQAQVERAAMLAQRISINLEAPGPERLSVLSKSKDFEADIMERMGWISSLVAQRRYMARGHTTQFVVGAAGETDAEIVSTADGLYRKYDLSRAYYSKFQPVPETPLENLQPADFVREHRLYQVDFLMRKYGFSGDEIPFEPDGNLSLQHDPKAAWARVHPEWFPVEVNRADPQQLLRVPGLGPVTVRRIMAARAQGKLKYLSDIEKFGAVAKNAAPYLLFDGKTGRRQLSLL